MGLKIRKEKNLTFILDLQKSVFIFWLEDAAFSPTLIYMEDDRLSLLDQVEEAFMIWLKDAAFVPYYDLHGRRSHKLTWPGG